MQEGGIKSGSNVLIIDDLIATGTYKFFAPSPIDGKDQNRIDPILDSTNNKLGGSASAAGQLVEKCGAQVIENLFVIEIELYVLFLSSHLSH